MSRILTKEKQKRPKAKKMNVLSQNTSKAISTKEKLIANARQVFTKSPYKTASLRNIYSNHNLIKYHFGSKADLFNALTSNIIEDITNNIPSFVQGIDQMPPQKGLKHFLKQFLDYVFVNPASMMIINQNLGNSDESESGFPGIDIMQAIHTQLFTSFLKILPKKSSKKDLERWCIVFQMYVINFLGAASSNQAIFKLKPYEHTYKKWVENFILLHMFPSFNHLIVGAQAKEFDDILIEKREIKQKNLILSEPVASKTDTLSKGDVTRKEILKAARRVFAKHPYDAASIRMIGNEGNMDFTLIHHYFPTKEDLFLANASELIHEYWRQAHMWVKDAPEESFHKRSDSVADRMLNFLFTERDAISLIMQNISNTEVPIHALPGFKHFFQFMEEIEVFVQIKKQKKQAIIWLNGLLLFYLYSIGSSHYFARILKIGPNSKTYKKWIKDTQRLIFYPTIRRLIIAEQ